MQLACTAAKLDEAQASILKLETAAAITDASRQALKKELSDANTYQEKMTQRGGGGGGGGGDIVNTVLDRQHGSLEREDAANLVLLPPPPYPAATQETTGQNFAFKATLDTEIAASCGSGSQLACHNGNQLPWFQGHNHTVSAQGNVLPGWVSCLELVEHFAGLSVRWTTDNSEVHPDLNTAMGQYAGAGEVGGRRAGASDWPGTGDGMQVQMQQQQIMIMGQRVQQLSQTQQQNWGMGSIAQGANPPPAQKKCTEEHEQARTLAGERKERQSLDEAAAKRREGLRDAAKRQMEEAIRKEREKQEAEAKRKEEEARALEATRREQRDFTAHYNVACAHADNGEHELAKNEFSQALIINSKDGKTYQRHKFSKVLKK